MRISAKTGMWAVVLGLFVALAVFGLRTSSALAEIDSQDGDAAPEALFVAAYGIVDSEDCDQAAEATLPRWNALSGDTTADNKADGGDVFKLAAGQSVLICVNADDGEGDITFDAADVGKWDNAACGFDGSNSDGDINAAEFPDDACEGGIGEETALMVVQQGIVTEGEHNDLDVVIVRYTCSKSFGAAAISIYQGEDTPTDSPQVLHFTILCEGAPDTATVTAAPTTVEIVPARGNTSHSLISVVLSSSSGPVFPVGEEVQFITDKCAIETSGVDTTEEFLIARALVAALPRSGAGLGVTVDPLGTFGDGFTGTWDAFADLALPDSSPLTDLTTTTGNGVIEIDADANGVPDLSVAAAIFHAEVTGCTPGPATITVIVEVPGGADLVRTVQVQIVGPPASITMSAAPTSVRCGEMVSITATVKDAIGQNVSDHTLVEMVTNLGGVLGGTGAVAASAGPVVPISSTVAETFGGIANAFLLTSESHSGPYVVIGTTGGTAPFDTIPTTLGGIFSTPPISNNVSISCSIPAAAAPTAAAPAVTAPRTGQGSIVPPNTGDAGLLSENTSSSSWTLLALGSIGLALAGVAIRKLVKS